jgi:Flp pilus assembly CpaE family ATPase
VRIRRGTGSEAALADQLYALDTDGERRLFLPGLADPAQAVALQPLWPEIVDRLAAAEVDVIADVGRIGAPDTPETVLARADRVLVVTRPTLVDLSAAAPRVRGLGTLRGNLTGPEVVLTGKGPYGKAEITRLLGAEVVAWMPPDRWSVPALTHGSGRVHPQSPLMKGARGLAGLLTAQAVRREAVAR